MKKTKPTKQQTDLPADVKPGDLKAPSSWKDALPYAECQKLGLQSASLRFYKTAGFGWVLLTLHISNPSRRSVSQTSRSYGVTLDGKVVRVGKGPHVLQEIEVHLTTSNIERLMKYVDLMNQGLGDAGQIRDRISSRRAQGQLYRQQGRSSWMW